MEPYFGMFRDPQRGLACLHAIEMLITRHLEADRGVQAAQPLQYVHGARTAAELEATGGEKSGRGTAGLILPVEKAPGRPQVASSPRPASRPVQTPHRAGKVPWA